MESKGIQDERLGKVSVLVRMTEKFMCHQPNT